METGLVRRETLTALVGTYNQAVAQVEQAYNLLDAAKVNLRTAFVSDYFYVTSGNHYGTFKDDLDEVLDGIKRQAWRVIVDRLELRRILSISRRDELDRQLSGESRSHRDKAQPLPDITEENILAMLQDGMANATAYANEAIYEVFDWLRPRSGRIADLKTNNKWMLGKKVIIGYAIEPGYGRGRFRPNYHREKNLVALDNVFHMLDGRGPLPSHKGPLCDAITDSKDGKGETDFFIFKGCKNQNLHVEFKRLDLVAKINKIAGGGNRIGGGNATQAQ